MKKIFVEIIAFLLALALLIGACCYLGYLYMPERQDTGATWHKYLKEPKESVDVMFVGSSLAYCDIIPARIYEETGLTSYVLAAPYMKPDIAYYYLKEALRTQSPEVVLLEASSFFFADSEADYYKVNIGYMPYTVNRLQATLDAPAKYRFGLLFPLYNYHSRWQNVHPATYFTGRRDAEIDLLAGYSPLDTYRPQEKRVERVFPATEEEREENLGWLEKIKALCDKEQITLELFVVPSCEYMGQKELTQLQAAAGTIPLHDFNRDFEAMGLDPARDFYDSRHTCHTGAEKFSLYLSDFMLDRYTLTGGPHNRELWQERTEMLSNITTKPKEGK